MTGAVGRTALLVAGGTGGHLFPALALREALMTRGWAVHVATDPRVGAFIQGVPAAETHRVRAATLGGSPPLWIGRNNSRRRPRRPGARGALMRRTGWRTWWNGSQP